MAQMGRPGLSPEGKSEVWQRQSGSARKREDDRLLGLIKHHWLTSGGVYGYRKITMDLRESGETCSRHRVLRLMRTEGLRAEVGYGSKPRHRGGPVGVVANVLNREFAPDAPNRVWVTDITYIRTYEGWLYLAADGSVLASDRRLGHAINDDQRPGIAGFAGRSLETQTGSRRYGAFGSGQSVHQR